MEAEEVEVQEEGTTEVTVPRMEGDDTVAREGAAEGFAVVRHEEAEGIGENAILNGKMCTAKLKMGGGSVGNRMANHRVTILIMKKWMWR